MAKKQTVAPVQSASEKYAERMNKKIAKVQAKAQCNVTMMEAGVPTIGQSTVSVGKAIGNGLLWLGGQGLKGVGNTLIGAGNVTSTILVGTGAVVSGKKVVALKVVKAAK